MILANLVPIAEEVIGENVVITLTGTLPVDVDELIGCVGEQDRDRAVATV